MSITPVPNSTETSSATTVDERRAFIQRVEAFIKGDEQPAHPASAALVASIKASVADRDALTGQLQEAEKSFRQAQQQHTHLSGKIDGLVESLHRLETHAED